MQMNLQDKVDLKRLWKEQNQCCQSLVKWSAALVRLLSRSRQARWQMRGLWYSIFHTSGYQNFSASLPRFFLHYGWSNSSRDTDPSAASSLSYMFFMIVFMVFFPTGVFLYQTLETVLSMTVSKQRTAFLHFRLGRFSRYRLNNMMGHLSSFTGARILVFTLSPSCLVLVGPSKKVRSSFPSSSRC